MFELKPVTPELFKIMEQWWTERKFPSPPEIFIPPAGRVVFSKGEETPICGGFLFKTDANVAVIAHLVSDKKVPFEIRTKALDYLIVALTALGKKDGFRMVTCSTNLINLMKRFECLGFTKTDDKVSQFGRIF